MRERKYKNKTGISGSRNTVRSHPCHHKKICLQKVSILWSGRELGGARQCDRGRKERNSQHCRYGGEL